MVFNSSRDAFGQEISAHLVAIETCRRRGVEDAKVLPFERIESLGGRHFDTVVMFGNNFGLFGSARRSKALLKALHLAGTGWNQTDVIEDGSAAYVGVLENV
jgi:hypothetical protein